MASKDLRDIQQNEHYDDGSLTAKKAKLYGETSGGVNVPVQVTSDGKLVVSLV